MREHAIPQDITGYQFHIIGSMTLIQFGKLAAGVILALIIYATNLVTPVKWGLIFTAVGIGAAAAFLPIQERPLEHWIVAFFKQIYNPTKFYWKRKPHIPAVFTYDADPATQVDPGPDLSPARQQRIREYLATVNQGQLLDEYDQLEQQRLNQIFSEFQTVTPEKVTIDKQNIKPGLKVRVRGLSETTETATTQPPIQTTPLANQVAQTIEIPKNQTIQVAAQTTEAEAAVQSPAQSQAVFSQTQAKSEEIQTNEAVMNASLPFPQKPTTPNKIVGMILTTNNELIPDAVVNIKDEQSRIVRAVKTNALGQFYITTPLKPGNYTIAINHDNYQFQSLEISLEDEIVDPIEIRSLS